MVIEEVNMVKIHYMHVWKSHNEIPPCNTKCANTKIKDKNDILIFRF
jgi:hypothetical protein